MSFRLGSYIKVALEMQRTAIRHAAGTSSKSKPTSRDLEARDVPAPSYNPNRQAAQVVRATAMAV